MQIVYTHVPAIHSIMKCVAMETGLKGLPHLKVSIQKCWFSSIQANFRYYGTLSALSFFSEFVEIPSVRMNIHEERKLKEVLHFFLSHFYSPED